LKKARYYMYLTLVILGALMLSVPVTGVFRYAAPEQHLLAKAFDSSGAEFVEANINIYSSKDDMFLKGDQVTSIVKSLASEVGVDYEANEKVENFSRDYNQLSLIGVNDSGQHVVIIVHSMDFSEVEDDGGYETNIVLDISDDRGYQNLGRIERSATDVVEGFIEGARVASCVIGRYEDKVSGNDREDIIKSIIESVGASEVDRTVYDEMVSVSAYAPGITEHIEIDQKRINLNIAFRYNSYEGRTYIWLGSPVISMEY
jgi:hypothetical protein